MKRLIAFLLLFALLQGTALSGNTVYSQTTVVPNGIMDAKYAKFLNKAEALVTIPGVAEGFVPQGVEWIPQKDWLLFSGYQDDGGVSPLIAVDIEKGGIAKEIFLHYPDGTVFSGHAGGVCATDKNIYIASGHSLLRLSLSVFLTAENGDSCAIEEEIPVPVLADFCCSTDEMLWVGEFGETSGKGMNEAHGFYTADGYHYAWACGYPLLKTTEKELAITWSDHGKAIPECILSITEHIQGMSVRGNEIYLSQSKGSQNASSLLEYAIDFSSSPHAEVEMDNADIPVWFADISTLQGLTFCPPMSEGICFVDDKICITFESAANKYIDIAKSPTDQVFMFIK